MAHSQPITILAGTSLSAAFDIELKGGCISDATLGLVAIAMPDAWTAASITLQGSVDGQNFFDIYDMLGAEFVVSAAANRYIVLDPSIMYSVKHFKIRSGTSGTPVNQGSDRVLTCLFRGIT